MKKLIGVLIISFLVMLTACNQPVEDSQEEQPVEENEEGGVEEEVVDEEETDGEQGENGEHEDGNDVESPEEAENGEGEIELADEKELTFEIEGQTETRVAQFNRSELGYGIYVLEGYTLHSEEPGRDALVFNNDGDFFTRIIPHKNEGSAEKLKGAIEEHAQGEIENLQDLPMSGLQYALKESVEISGERTTIYHLAKEAEGELFQLTVFLPAKEAQEGVAPSMLAMLETVHP
ncbi:hypothetical protein PQ478_12800 [Alkalihalophilus pseudofirmus]|uniref:hypothetical protein n=1 Tax=Alkalihalophilus pseudofirmus TaxID=79885 RepID=UPI00259B9E00|nr:hypothetical protein [Alkalihalophilus pseudofirmus]WEG15414.1 hypothetical protein PQ478_12800 [Alkalihalophilus pseudofirmus]